MSMEILNGETMGICSVCGEELTMFGSKELKNGTLCRNCAKKISQWITDEELKLKKVSSVKAHLVNREKNKAKLESFRDNLKAEGKYTIYMDTEKKIVAVSKKSDFRADNSDVIPVRLIKNVSVSVKPYEDTENVDVYLEMDVRNRMFEKISFRVNEFPGLLKDSEELKEALEAGKGYIKALVESGLVKERKVKGEVK